FNVISYEDTVGAMLQEAIWADTERLDSDEDYQDTTVAFLKAVVKGWIYAAENPESAAEGTVAADAVSSRPDQLVGFVDHPQFVAGAPTGTGSNG
ncbi:ABC transporter substrate-binding protein, partial [Salinibacterium amurskyense]